MNLKKYTDGKSSHKWQNISLWEGKGVYGKAVALPFT